MGIIVSVKRFEIHDGDGVRTTLFLKGCPLNCRWCHNPESICALPTLFYNPQKCINCGECSNICDCHTTQNSLHNFKRENCISCGKCADACLGDALVLYGKEFSADEILPKLLEDKPFFEESGGGITISGGEPLIQSEFCTELLKKLKEQGVNTAVDTCGFVKREDIDRVLPFTDTFLYDIKAINPEVHKKCTGVTNEIILENLKYIDSLNKQIEIRIPFIPTMNSGEMRAIAEFLSNLKSVKKIKILPYHPFGASKYEFMGKKYALNIPIPSDNEINDTIKIFNEYGLVAIKE
ncbi:MAG: glycyl-radical enzyme activating protein [Ruminococcaceae bacterium]|nr:glycyl-radical enzyme activating protein [Oscillospiraceae bacterium]